jgi:hypothetical protein
VKANKLNTTKNAARVFSLYPKLYSEYSRYFLNIKNLIFYFLLTSSASKQTLNIVFGRFKVTIKAKALRFYFTSGGYYFKANPVDFQRNFVSAN